MVLFSSGLSGKNARWAASCSGARPVPLLFCVYRSAPKNHVLSRLIGPPNETSYWNLTRRRRSGADVVRVPLERLIGDHAGAVELVAAALADHVDHEAVAHGR